MLLRLSDSVHLVSCMSLVCKEFFATYKCNYVFSQKNLFLICNVNDCLKSYGLWYWLEGKFLANICDDKVP